MKKYLQLILLLTMFLIYSCKKKTIKAENKLELKKTKKSSKDSIALKKNIETPKHYEHKFVIAKSGLNYRSSPKGNVLGKFPLNKQLKIIEYTKISEEIKDNERIIKGEWVGVEKKLDTVYVFNGFLSYNYLVSDIKLYNSTSYYKDNNGKGEKAFLNISETYFKNKHKENVDRSKNLILTEKDLIKDTIKLNSNQRKKIFNKLNLSESDKVYVYIIKNDIILTFNIKDLTLIAQMNAYGPSSDAENQENDYYFGFDLGEKIMDWNNFVYIGKENPFQIGQLKPVIWNQIENENFPINNDLKKNKNSFNTFLFTTEEYEYFLQQPLGTDSYHLIVIANKSRSIVLNQQYSGSEWGELTELNVIGKEKNTTYQSQWTGKLFKNKEAILFGFFSHSFGCPSISVLDETEPSIPILCDNRH